MATMVSSAEAQHPLRAGRDDPDSAGNDDRLHERVADALRADRRIFGDRQVNDAAFVGIERTHLLRRAAALGLFRDEARHLPQLRVLVPAEAVAVDHDALVVAELATERRGHEVLQRLEAFAAAP